MSYRIKMGAGFIFLVLGLGYLYRPDMIMRMNAIIRDTFLNDAYITLERRKYGTFFLLLSLLFFYMGYVAQIAP